MALLMAFFVMLLASANQDKQKLADASGSLKDAFGVQPIPRTAGMIERDGLPVRKFIKQSSAVDRKLDAETSALSNDKRSQQGPENNTHDFEQAKEEKPKQFLTAAASLRQALQDMPEITEVSKHVMFEETDEGLNIRLVDQDGRTMFAEGSKQPYEFTRSILSKLAGPLARIAAPHPRLRPHRRRVALGRQGPVAVGSLRRSRRRGRGDPVGIRRAQRPFRFGRRQGRHRSALPQRAAARRQPAHRHPARPRAGRRCRPSPSTDGVPTSVVPRRPRVSDPAAGVRVVTPL